MRVLLLILSVSAVTGRIAAQSPDVAQLPASQAAPEKARQLPPPKGSQLASDDNNCAMCHAEEGLWEGDTLRLFLTPESLAEDVHFRNGVNCHDCHGGTPDTFEPGEAHATEDGFRELVDVRESCALCHQRQSLDLVMGVHCSAGKKDQRGRGTPLECGDCHGEKAHGMLPVGDKRSPVFLDGQVETCGGCHEKDLHTYTESVHGEGLSKPGETTTAVCADCHGAHGIFRSRDERSTLHLANVADTCGTCHEAIEERIQQSVHGRGQGPGGRADRVAPGGKQRREPSCTDCHQGHDLPHPKSASFRLQLRYRCGNCHPELSGRYAMSLHGELTELGYGPAAKCSDCHGAHDVLPPGDPKSHLADGNRLKTCRKCHPGAVAGLSGFLAHADHKDGQRYPGLHRIYVAVQTVFFLVFGVFGLHTIVWFVRSLIRALGNGHPHRLVPGQNAYLRFELTQRLFHSTVVLSLLGLAVTGLPLKYSNQSWAVKLADALGGFGSTSVWHRVCAVVIFSPLVAHLVWLAMKVVERRRQAVPWKTLAFGPDSPLPNRRDAKDMAKMVRWFFGLGPKPLFERWAYWEKFDYWALFFAITILGSSGLLLWFPNVFCRVLPGEALNVAKVIHSEQALLGIGFILAIYLFSRHLRAEKFPLDLSVITGLAAEEELKSERPEFLERMQAEGKLDGLRATVPSRKSLRLMTLAGAIVLFIGMGLLTGIVLANLGM